MLENAFKYKIRDNTIRKADANARITWLESKNVEMEPELDKVERGRDIHENSNNPRTGTVLAGQRRAFRAKEREKQAAD